MTKKQWFNKEYIFTEFDKLSTKIIEPTHFFVIGGLALINYGLKNATKDIDAVVRSQTLDFQFTSLESSEYRISKNCSIPRLNDKKEKITTIENKDGFKWEIFHTTVCDALIFSDAMVSRATEVYAKGKMTVSVASKEDTFLFKGMTEREADLDDMRLLAKLGLDWQIIKTECLHQSSISGRLWEDALLQNLVVLRKRHKIRSPIEKELRRIAEGKLIEDFLVKSIVDGLNTFKSISEAKMVPYCFVRDCALTLEKRGLLKFDKTQRPYKLSVIKL